MRVVGSVCVCVCVCVCVLVVYVCVYVCVDSVVDFRDRGRDSVKNSISTHAIFCNLVQSASNSWNDDTDTEHESMILWDGYKWGRVQKGLNLFPKKEFPASSVRFKFYKVSRTIITMITLVKASASCILSCRWFLSPIHVQVQVISPSYFGVGLNR